MSQLHDTRDRWHVLRTRVISEGRAVSGLMREGVDVYSPRVKVPSGSGHVVRALFPGYVFIRCSEDQGWESLRRIPGVLGVVRYGGEVPWLTNQEMDVLRTRVDETNSGGGLWRRYEPGERVNVKWGSLESIGEVLEQVERPDKRVRVLLEILGRRALAKVPWSSLSPHTVEIRPRGTRGKGRWIKGQGPRALQTI